MTTTTMEWLAESSLLEMRGPAFLVLYMALLALGWCALLFVRRKADPTRGEAPPLLPDNFDWREIAWLRGGPDELVRLTGLDLMQRGHLKMGPAGQLEHVSALEMGECSLAPGARGVLELVRAKVKPSRLLKDGGKALAEEMEVYEARAAEERLLMPPSAQVAVRIFSLCTLAVLLLLGWSKIVAAVSHGHSNIGFLFALTVIAIILFLLAGKMPRLSARGQAFVDQAQVAFTDLRVRAPEMAEAASPMLLMAAGIYGMGVLDATSLANYRQFYHPPAAGTSSCGSGCSSGGSGCSGGSSCGGGGCGGCGGGGD